MNSEQLKEQYQKSDKSLVFLKRCLLIAFLFLAVASMVVGIIFIANSQESYNHPYGMVSTRTNGVFLGLGFAFLCGGPLVCLFFYEIAMVLIWLMFDIKVIRTAVTGEEFSEYLKSFSFRSNYDYSTSYSADSTKSNSNNSSSSGGSAIGNCELCDAKSVPLVEVKIKNKYGTFYRRVCADCLRKQNEGDNNGGPTMMSGNPMDGLF